MVQGPPAPGQLVTVRNRPWVAADVVAGIPHRPGCSREAGSADLCSYFLLRDLSVASTGRTGIIATNTIAQGDTREVGLDQAVSWGWGITRAVKSQPWPGTASLEVSLVWMGHASQRERKILDGREVARITSSLHPESRVTGNPHRLAANANQSFQGSIVLGKGFILEPDQAHALMEKDPRNKDVLFPYLIGDDINQRWDSSASRWVIDFHNWPEEEARRYAEVFEVVERDVRPQRMEQGDVRGQIYWWRHLRSRPELRAAIAKFERVLVIARVSKTGLPVFASTNQVVSEQAVVFASDQGAVLSLLSSAMHYFWWTIKGNSTMRTDAPYTPSDGFETFARPGVTEWMDRIGEELASFRRAVMERRRVGLTSLYNLVHDEAVHNEDVRRLREIHVEIDEAVREAYALDEEREPAIWEYEGRAASESLPRWRDIELGHAFHKTRQGVRFTISPQAQYDVLDKLLALNRYRHEQELSQGIAGKKRRKSANKRTTSSGSDGLF